MVSPQDTAKNLKEIGYEMSLLLVEDDDILQSQLKTFLTRFFGHVDVASNGVEALALYDKRHYDLVVTDLTMPIMGGIKLSHILRSRSEKQKIFVVSAHSESDKRIELINIGVDGFMLKPINITTVLSQLMKTCQAIYDHKMLEYFSTMLEETNKELRSSNIDLECALNELKRLKTDTTSVHATSEFVTHIHTGREMSNDERMMLYTRSDKMSAVEFFDVYPFELDKTNEDLEILEDQFNFILVKSENSPIQEVLSDLIKILRSYGQTIEMIPQFSALAYGIHQLAFTFESIQDTQKLREIMPMLTHLFDNLDEWRRSIFFYRNAEDIHYMDNSLLSDALSLQGLLDNQHVSSESDIELF